MSGKDGLSWLKGGAIIGGRGRIRSGTSLGPPREATNASTSRLDLETILPSNSGWRSRCGAIKQRFDRLREPSAIKLRISGRARASLAALTRWYAVLSASLKSRTQKSK